MKLRRREFLKGIVPALLGGKRLVEELLKPAPEVVEVQEVQIATPTSITGFASYLPLAGREFRTEHLPPIAPWERDDLFVESSDRPGVLYPRTAVGAVGRGSTWIEDSRGARIVLDEDGWHIIDPNGGSR